MLNLQIYVLSCFYPLQPRCNAHKIYKATLRWRKSICEIFFRWSSAPLEFDVEKENSAVCTGHLRFYDFTKKNVGKIQLLFVLAP